MLNIIATVTACFVIGWTYTADLEYQHMRAFSSLVNRCEPAQWDNQNRVTLLECATNPDQFTFRIKK